ncbi:MAG: hypothetical protein ABIL58_15685 [Pseudomonadota bacterium]
MRRGFVAITALAVTLIVVGALGGVGVYASDYVQQIGEGSVNWTKGTIQSKGIGAPPQQFYGKPNARPMALRAARVVALRNILETVNGVRIDSETVVKDFAVSSDVVSSRVQGFVRGARQVSEEYMSDGTVEVIMEINMYGELTDTMLPQTVMAPAPPPPAASPGPSTSNVIYTGLVVDARGLGVRPAMAPKVLDENGQEVYGSAFVSREYAVQQGMSGYAKELGGAKENERVTNNPLVVKALRVEGPGKCDLIIGNMDASMLRGAADTLSFLQKCRVMIVVD